MQAPIVIERIPATSGSNCDTTIPINMLDTGFPFDDEADFDRDRSFNSHLSNIVERHPELAEHFNGFPFRSNSWGNKRRGSASASEEPKASSSEQTPQSRPEYSQTRGEHPQSRPEYSHTRGEYPQSRAEFPQSRAEFPQSRSGRSFGSRFEPFFAPHARDFDDDIDYYREFEPPHPTHPQPPPKPQQEEQYQQKHQEPTEKPPPVPTSERGRKQNIQPSNTVDLGQKQPPVDDTRGQRSMSAPPENRAGQQRYVSSINIPINADNSSDMGGRQSQPQPPPQQASQNKPTERVIPIHVEGRDEPVMPKNVHQTFSQAPPQTERVYTTQQPQPERVFGQRNPFGQWGRTEPGFYMNRNESPQPQKSTPEESFRQQQQQYQKQQQQNFQQQKSPTPPPQPAPQPPAATSGPIEQIQSIQKEVLDLMTQVEQFNGKPRDKQYMFLDEMLTRNLLKLDNVETDGKENIRQARKEAIKCIQRCISILETKAAANEQIQRQMMGADLTADAPPAVETESKVVESENKENDASQQTNEQPEAMLVVSGVSRSGSLAEQPAQETSIEVENSTQNKSENAATGEAAQSSVVQTEQNKEGEPMEVETAEKQAEAAGAGDSSQPKEENKATDKKEKKKVKKKDKAAEKN